MITATVRTIDNRGYRNLHTGSFIAFENIEGELDAATCGWLERGTIGFNPRYAYDAFQPGDRVTLYFAQTYDGAGWYVAHR